ncbi:hypothetical protein FHETE_6654 [Fusarium heterosporum]|uniref:Uncharacterized protein n=1 Tax=Fusarium heterosporum TaxID=42747 RepID=A0A8H5TA20_FUSHE|nr:hypothetical protein FHETE_6654 [Fusarium heterosporum]
MSPDPDYVYCTICGMGLDELDCVVLCGPNWPCHEYEETPPSLKVADEDVTRYDAKAHNYRGGITLLPNNERISPQEEYDIDPPPEDPSAAKSKRYLGIHSACETLVDRLFTTFSNPHVRSVGDLWLTLDIRCESHTNGHWDYNYVPTLFNRLTGQRDFEGYYIPRSCIERFGNEWEGWWDADPIGIPDLTTCIISNLEKAGDVSGTQMKNLIEASPNEISDHIRSFVPDIPLSLECTYIMPQYQWAEVFFTIPFLWDLDTKVVHEKTGSSRFDLEQWNWEKLTRQILSPLHGSSQVQQYDDNEEVWNYSRVGLDVPDGLANRRRIWQILLDMNPKFELDNAPKDF